MKQIIGIILTLAILCGLCSCGFFSTPSDEEMREAIKKLLPDAYAVTYIVYGPGLNKEKKDYESFLKLKEEQQINNIHYVNADPEMEFPGCDVTVWDESTIRSATRKVFAKEYADEILAYAFESNDVTVGRYNTVGKTLRIEVVKHEQYDMLDEIFTDTLTVIEGNSYACTVEVDAKQNGEQKRVKIQMVYENEQWLFNGAAY